MALRVLLADESVTIKKVFQLALQDFAVEVTSVNVGVDVVNVALKIKPDIIFADVLLQKKGGYDVCREVKSHPELGRLPVVLIWSGFMELDDAKYKSSGANAHLEKPFDTQRLRHIIQTLVTKTKSQPIANYLTFPKLPDFDDTPTTKEIPPLPNMSPSPHFNLPPDLAPMPPSPPTQPSIQLKVQPNVSGGMDPISEPTEDEDGGWTMDHFAEPLPEIPKMPDVDEVTSFNLEEPADEFAPLKLATEPMRQRPPPLAEVPALNLVEEPVEEDAQWVQKSISKYKLDPSKRSEAPPKISYNVSDEKIDPESFVSNAWSGRIQKQTSVPLANSLMAQKPTMKVGPGAPPQAPIKVPKIDQKPIAKKPVDENEDEIFELDLGSEPAGKKSLPPQLSEEQLETLIRAQSKEVIEKVVWQVVPEIATRIIERELERLLSERNRK